MIANLSSLAIANARALEQIQALKTQLELENAYLRKEIDDVKSFGDIIGNSPPLLNVLNQVELVAPTDATVVIYGESGTGKELIAREIHQRSNRQAKPMLKVNCSTIPENLYESEFLQAQLKRLGQEHMKYEYHKISSFKSGKRIADNFRSKKENRAVLNIGGIANITFLPKEDNKSCFGFDTGPGNMLMDSWISQHKQQPYDKDGEWAGSAKANEELVKRLMNDDFIHQQPPKSTGREHYNIAWLNTQLKDFPQLSADIIQASLCDFTARSISYAVEHYLPEITSLIICGGGAHNKHLIAQLGTSLNKINIDVSDQYNLPADWVEAAAFAWLAKQTLEGKAGNLPDVTGAKQSTILGAIYPA
jgi:hypothetical protein